MSTTDPRWQRLLLARRFRDKASPSQYDGRDEFENDYSRLISSAPIRRLQDKTQVFPLEQSDFVRTRLTHSLEVSSIARSIGKSLERKLIAIGKYPENLQSQLSSLLATAGLIHDLGNPPFGHFGEKAIQHFFEDHFQKNNHELSKQEQADFVNFDGNVQTFRILRKLYYLVDNNGYNLSFPTLSTIIKYPCSSIQGNIPKEKRNHVKDKKFGFFASEEADFKTICSELGLNNQRHPVTYLLEAADDIAFIAADIEDGAKLGIVTYGQIKDVLQELSEKDFIDSFKNNYQQLKATDVDQLDISIQRLRIKMQTFMVESIIDEFLSNYENIMDGSYPNELLAKGKAAELKNKLDELMKIILASKKVINIELAGWNVIQGLLREYIPACLTKEFKKNSKTKEGRLYLTISSSYRYLYESFPSYQNDTYNRIQLVTDFVSGMTDSYALQLFQKLTGIRTS
jgi:dGTPase